MTFLSVAAAFAAYVFVGLLFCLTVLAAVINWRGLPPLLDGSPLGSVLDDSDRRRHIADAEAASATYLASERLSMELDYQFSLPAVEHP